MSASLRPDRAARRCDWAIADTLFSLVARLPCLRVEIWKFYDPTAKFSPLGTILKNDSLKDDWHIADVELRVLGFWFVAVAHSFKCSIRGHEDREEKEGEGQESEP